MCGRYRLKRHWERDLLGTWHLLIEKIDLDAVSAGSDEAFPSERMPIIRHDENGDLIAELRHWGVPMDVTSKRIDPATGTPKKVRKTVFNAMSEKLTSSYAWRFAFRDRRCLIPMSSWDEWPEISGGKQRVRISMPQAGVFLAAGLYDWSIDPKTGARVPVFVMCTVPPNEFLGTVHDRAPMVLLPSQYEAWLAGGAAALVLIGGHPAPDAFDVKLV